MEKTPSLRGLKEHSLAKYNRKTERRAKMVKKMTKNLTTLALLLLVSIPNMVSLSNCALAEVTKQWVKKYNGVNSSDFANAIAVDASGNVYVTGNSAGTGNALYDYATVKYRQCDEIACTEWERRYAQAENKDDHPYAVAVDDLGNVYVTGSSGTIKYDADGNQVWIGPEPGYDIAVDASYNVYTTGGNPDYVTVKYDPDGDVVWLEPYDGEGGGVDKALAIAVDDDGNAYVTGYSMGSGTSRDYATIKYNSSGGEVWVTPYNGPVNASDSAVAIAVDPDGNVYVTGRSKGDGTGYDCATVKYDALGDQVWERRYTGPADGDDNASDIALSPEGYVFVTGWSDGTETSEDYITIKYNLAGDELWVKRYNGPGNSADFAYAMALDDYGCVYVTGRSRGNGTGYDYATVKYDPHGNQEWDERHNEPGNRNEVARDITVQGPGNVYVTGSSYRNETSNDYDFATIKYVQNGPPTVFAGPDADQDGVHDDSPFQFNEIISFEGEAIPEGTASITSWEWRFDDGTVVEGTKGPYDVDHQYFNLYGEHTAVFTAWDNSSQTSSDKLSVWIEYVFPQVGEIWASYDGISDEDIIGTFISGLTAQNTFYASVTEGDTPIESVVFDLEGEEVQGTYDSEAGRWQAYFADIGFLDVGDNTLTATAYDALGNPAVETVTVRMRDTPSWFDESWLSLFPHHQAYEFVTDDGTPYYDMEVSMPEPRAEWGPYNFDIGEFFPDLTNHFKVFLGIQGKFPISGYSEPEDYYCGGSLIAKLLGEGLDEEICADQMVFEGTYGDLVEVVIHQYGYEIPPTTIWSQKGTIATFWVCGVKIDVKYSTAFGLEAHVYFSAVLGMGPNEDSYLALNPGIEPWVSLDVWADIFFGAAEVGMNFTPTFGIDFPCTVFVSPAYRVTEDHCAYFILYYSVWASVGWGLWEGTLYKGSGFEFDHPNRCHWGKDGVEYVSPDMDVIDSAHQYFPQVFETPSVAVDPNSDRAVAVWMHDKHPEDTSQTDPEVYYAFYDGSGWTHGPITANDRWETNPKVAFLSSDTVIAVWTQNEIPKAQWGSVTDLNQVLNNQELYYSVGSISTENWTAPVRITSNSVPDGCADLQAGRGAAILSWVRDLDGNPNTRRDWEVFYSWYRPGVGWRAPAPLSQGGGSNFQPAAALDERTGRTIVVWTHEPDGDFNTPGDRKLYYRYVHPFFGPDTLGTNLPLMKGPLNPSVAFASGGRPIIAYTWRSVRWVNGQPDTVGVGFEDKLRYCYYTGLAWSDVPALVNDAEVVAMNPIIKVDYNNRAMMVYRGFEGEGVTAFDGEISSVSVDLKLASPQEGEHVRYTSDAHTTWMPAFDVNKLGNGKLVYVTYGPQPPDPSFGSGMDNMYIGSPSWSYLRGDVTGDGVIDVADVMFLIRYLFVGEPAPAPLELGDVNCDGEVHIADVVYLINYLFREGPPPCEGGLAVSTESGPKLSKGTAPAQIGFSSAAIFKDGIMQLPIVCKSEVDIAAVDLEITYDPEDTHLLQLGSTPATDALQIYSSAKDGVQKIGILDLTGENYISGGTYALVNLKMKASDLGRLEITRAILVDRDAHQIPVQIVPEERRSEEDFQPQKPAIPQRFILSQNYPNPFNPRTSIRYALPQDAQVRLTIYNVLGQKVATLVDEYQAAGYRAVWWDGKDAEGDEVSSGVYFYRLTAGEFSEVKKMMMVK